MVPADWHFSTNYGHRAAYLYSNGLLLYQPGDDEEGGVTGPFREVTISDADFCWLMADISPEALKPEANGDWIAITEWTDAPATKVFLEAGEDEALVSMYGDLFEKDDLVPEYALQAPNAITLAERLHALASGGQLYESDAVEVMACEMSDDHQSAACQLAEAVAWPFAEIDVFSTAVECSSGDPPVSLAVGGELADEVRAWWIAETESEPCSTVMVAVDGKVYDVRLIESPLGGEEAMPFAPCCQSSAEWQ